MIEIAIAAFVGALIGSGATLAILCLGANAQPPRPKIYNSWEE
jgi:hypothetical protein